VKKIIKEYKEATRQEIFEGIRDNFTFGFLGAILVVFISLRVDLAVLAGYLVYLPKSTTVFLNYQVPPNSSFKYCSFSQSLYIEHSSISKSSSISLGKPVSISN